MSPIGAIHWLKNGAATVMRVPVTASLSVGNIVAEQDEERREQQDPVVHAGTPLRATPTNRARCATAGAAAGR